MVILKDIENRQCNNTEQWTTKTFFSASDSYHNCCNELVLTQNFTLIAIDYHIFTIIEIV